MDEQATALYERAYREHEGHLWHLLYRMTGSPADADDLLQETFVRAIEKPPPDVDQPLLPWLVRVAMNLGRDCLRRRRRTKYVGPWLPTPIETDVDGVPRSYELAGADGITTEGRYDLLESVSFAFLVALEALTPQQRAVLLLRDVFDYSVREVAYALDITEANVKTSHHRARAAMKRYDGERVVAAGVRRECTVRSYERMLEALGRRDVRAFERLLAEDVRAVSDGGGQFIAARRVIAGRDRVARFFLGIQPPDGARLHVEERTLNGLPALLVDYPDAGPRQARRFALVAETDRDGRVRAVYVVLAAEKLAYLLPSGTKSPG